MTDTLTTSVRIHPPVTAVVPTHNRPELMKRAVQSIVDQTYAGPIEILVVFDACEPQLPDVALPANRTLTALVNDRVRGLAGGRNTGILAATSGFVAFLDDDDYWFPEKLEHQMNLFAERPDALLVGTAMVVDDGERTHERLVPTDNVTHRDLLRKKFAGLHSSSFVFRRTALIEQLGMIDEDLPRAYGEDWDILLRTSAITDVPVVNRPLVGVTWQGQSYFFGKWALYADAMQYLLAKHEDLGADPRNLGHIQSQIAFALAASGQRREARAWSRKALRNDIRQPKAHLALAVAFRLITADRVARIVQRFGKGI